MKHLIFLFAILLQTNFCDAQKIRFTDTNNKWVFLCEDDPTPPVVITHYCKYQYIGDTMFNGQKYHGIYNPCSAMSPDGAYVREDTVLNRVYAWNSQLNDEIVFMDFSLNLNDTLTINNVKCVLNLIDSVLINNVWHKRQMFITGISVPFSVIEGVGCTFNGPFYPLNAQAIESICYFCSFSQGSNLMYSVPFICALNVGDQYSKKSKLEIAPNPITQQTKITLPYKISSGSLSIYDFTGRKIYNKEFHQKEDLHIGDSNFTPGIYFLQVKDLVNGKIFTEKFVQQ